MYNTHAVKVEYVVSMFINYSLNIAACDISPKILPNYYVNAT